MPLGRVEQGSHACREADWLGILGSKQGEESIPRGPAWHEESELKHAQRVVMCGHGVVVTRGRADCEGHPCGGKAYIGERPSAWGGCFRKLFLIIKVIYVSMKWLLITKR